jgi:cation transporter-like permease
MNACETLSELVRYVLLWWGILVTFALAIGAVVVCRVYRYRAEPDRPTTPKPGTRR